MQGLLYAYVARRPGGASRVPLGTSVLSSPGKAVELGTTGTWDRHCTRTEHPTPLGDTIDLAGAKFGAFIFVEISVFAGEREWNEPSDGEQLPSPSNSCSNATSAPRGGLLTTGGRRVPRLRCPFVWLGEVEAGERWTLPGSGIPAR